MTLFPYRSFTRRYIQTLWPIYDFLGPKSWSSVVAFNELPLKSKVFWWLVTFIKTLKLLKKFQFHLLICFTMFENDPKCLIWSFQKIAKLTIFGIFNELLSTRNVKFKCDIFNQCVLKGNRSFSVWWLAEILTDEVTSRTWL